MKGLSHTLLHWALRLLGPLLLLYFLLFQVDIRQVWQLLGQMNLWWFLLACVLLAPFLVLKGLRWKLILQAWHMDLPLVDAAALYGVGIFLGVITPGQAGDAVKAWYLRRRGHPLAPGLLSIVVDRFFDVAIMAVLAGTGIYFFRHFLPERLQWLMLLALMPVGLGLVVLGSGQLRRLLLRGIAPRVVPRRIRELAARSSLSGRSLGLSLPRLGMIGLVSALALTLTFIRVYMLFIAMGTSMPIGPFIAMLAMVALVSPLSIGGVGVVQAVMIPILTQYGLSADLSFTISALLLLLNVLNVLVGFVVSLRYPLADLRKPVQEEPVPLVVEEP